MVYHEAMERMEQDGLWNRVDNLLAVKGWNIGHLARSIRISANVLYHQRSMKISPKLEQVGKMAVSLDTTIDFLFFGDSEEADVSLLIKKLKTDKSFMKAVTVLVPGSRAASQSSLGAR